MKITLIADKENTAIHRLCVYTQKALPQHQFKIVCVHPKRPSQKQLDDAGEALNWCDVVDFRYWKSAELLRSMFDIKKPQMLTHYNPYDIEGHSWTHYPINVVVNAEQAAKMRGISFSIGLPVDLAYWNYSTEFDQQRMDQVIMVANRIEAKKGILPVAQACHELGINFVLVGRPSDATYLEKILAYDTTQYYEGVSDDELRMMYHNSGVHVCNSVDGFESGTMPILEAMACGVPVLTRRVGHVPDLFNGKNMVVRKGLPENVSELVELLKQMRDDHEWMKQMRHDAWQTIKIRSLDIYGLKYSKMYWSLKTEKAPVSVIIPTFNRAKTLQKTLAHLLASNWEHFEIIVCDDGSTDETKEMVLALAENPEISSKATIKYFHTALYKSCQCDKHEFHKTYGIANARNIGILHAEGEYLLFLDDRLAIDPDAIAAFMEKDGSKTWQWGEKDGVGKGFVENFSFIHRQTMVNLGGFSTMISQYGGITQEIRRRAEANKIKFAYNSGAKSKAIAKSGSKWGKMLDIAKSKAQCYALGYE